MHCSLRTTEERKSDDDQSEIQDSSDLTETMVPTEEEGGRRLPLVMSVVLPYICYGGEENIFSFCPSRFMAGYL